MDLFSAQLSLHTALDYHMNRQSILVSNVAHVDTPGYIPLDLDRALDKPTAFGIALERTQGGHLGAQGALPDDEGAVFEDRSAGSGLDGNYVSLDREAAKLAANQSRYDVIATLLSSEYRQLAYAANDGVGS